MAGDPADAARLLTAALDLWRGQPYGDWPDLPFADAERRRLAEVRTGAVTGAAPGRACRARGSSEARRSPCGEMPSRLGRRGRAAAAEDPLRRSGGGCSCWRCTAAAVRATRSRRWHGRGACSPSELGADPGPRLRAMEAAVLAQDPALDAAGGRSPLRRPLADRTSRPARTRGWPPTRRPTRRCSTAGAASSPGWPARLVDAPLVAVSGSSGAGKSSLVRAGLRPRARGRRAPRQRGWRGRRRSRRAGGRWTRWRR